MIKTILALVLTVGSLVSLPSSASAAESAGDAPSVASSGTAAADTVQGLKRRDVSGAPLLHDCGWEEGSYGYTVWTRIYHDGVARAYVSLTFYEGSTRKRVRVVDLYPDGMGPRAMVNRLGGGIHTYYDPDGSGDDEGIYYIWYPVEYFGQAWGNCAGWW